MIDNFEELTEGQLAGDLSAEQARSFTAHLAGCPGCRARFEAHQQAAAKLASLITAPLAPMSAGFADAVMRKVPPGPPPPAAGTAAPASLGLILLATGAGLALLIVGVVLVGRSRPGASSSPAPAASTAASAPPAAPASAEPTPAASLPAVPRPSAAIGGLGDDGAGGKTTR